MFKYVLKRAVYFVPTLLIISLLTFILSKMAPGDPVKLALGNKDNGGEAGQMNEKLAGERSYKEMAEKMGLNLPSFYFAVGSSAEPDTLYKFLKRPERETLSRLVDKYGNWAEIDKYYASIREIDHSLFDVVQDSSTFEPHRVVRESAAQLYITYDNADIERAYAEMKKTAASNPALKPVETAVNTSYSLYENMKKTATPNKNLIPSVKWYGIKNQYHRWLLGDRPWFSEEENVGTSGGFIRGDFGFSYLDKRPVWSKIKDALPWTLLLNFFSLLLAYLIAIPVGVWSATQKGTWKDNVVTVFLFLLNSLPVFWIATLVITFLTTEEYGMDFFPTFGLGEVSDDMNWFEVMQERGYHVLLPVFCLTYGSIAYLSRQMRGGVLSVFRQDYIRTARAKGLNERAVTWRHAFRNSLIPIITIFAHIFPAAIGGSFIIENIFSIPGMGKLAFEGLIARDFPMVFTVMMFSAILTLIGNLVADILYAVVDPRISFNK